MLSGINEELALPLLARRPVIREGGREWESVRGKRVMVTGAGGSIGSELYLQIASSCPAALTLVDHSEIGLYEINQTLDNSELSLERMAALADIRDLPTMRALFLETKPDIVFHAAALKHVPLMEANPNEAVRPTCWARATSPRCAWRPASTVAPHLDRQGGEAHHHHGRDQARGRALMPGLRPRSAPPARLRFLAVRFGNVLGSAGSVVPLFQRADRRRRAVTVTHPDMTRYFMTVRRRPPGAAAAAVSAKTLVTGRRLYVLDMGEPVRILELARQLIEQSGFRPGHRHCHRHHRRPSRREAA